MTRPLRILPLLLLACMLTAWAPSAHAARLATVNGQAGAEQATDGEDFVLSEQSTVTVSYAITERGAECGVQVRIYRKQNDRWLVVNTVLTAETNARGSTNLTLPRGDYRVVVIAVEASYNVTVDK